jgi:Fur family iron response transcriptional regulator
MTLTDARVSSKSKRAFKAPARDILAEAGLRPTRQRLALADLLFRGEPRHVSVDSLYDELSRRGAPGSLSCVYNSLRRFSDLGLLRRTPIYGETTYFDTQLDHHHHFYVVNEDRLMDVPDGQIAVTCLPALPDGYELESVDVVVRLRRTNRRT